jgi:hypothetical protein
MRLFVSHSPASPPPEAGQAAVETAFTLTVLLTFIFAVMTLCLMVYTYVMIAESAREASRYASTHGTSCINAANASCTLGVSAIESYATSRGWPNVGGGTMAATVSYLGGSEAPNSTVTVTVTYAFTVTMPLLSQSGNILHLSSSSTMVILQ